MQQLWLVYYAIALIRAHPCRIRTMLAQLMQMMSHSESANGMLQIAAGLGSKSGAAIASYGGHTGVVIATFADIASYAWTIIVLGWAIA